MNKYRRLSIAGSTIIIGLTCLIVTTAYFSIRKEEVVAIGKSANQLPDTVIIERIIEKPVKVIHDTVQAQCRKKHCELLPVNKSEITPKTIITPPTKPKIIKDSI